VLIGGIIAWAIAAWRGARRNKSFCCLIRRRGRLRGHLELDE
jgi:hypothetical protein